MTIGAGRCHQRRRAVVVDTSPSTASVTSEGTGTRSFSTRTVILACTQLQFMCQRSVARWRSEYVDAAQSNGTRHYTIGRPASLPRFIASQVRNLISARPWLLWKLVLQDALGDPP